ncbi:MULTISPECIES: hypothetical protein [unclassified Shewanella]|uniref:hypothetical protein n=1 Tax=unclassified Shewanella TaxID=196818 RepID=UPI000C834068|nr:MULTISPECIES: hypothetical protein [unclassified Shewanella]MDO6679992.1 hypothetical protein [Shewanella sp. 4_MG-2023]PMH86027.1 hypothetical protein BCU57_12615 [Shewanella sp. 10N.286.48.B5]
MSSQVTNYLHRSFIALFEEQDGQDIWSCIKDPTNIVRMETAIYLGKTPLESITPELLKLDIFKPDSGQDVQRQNRFKQLTGSLVKYMLCNKLDKYQLNDNKTKLRASEDRQQIFSAASTYKAK